MVQGRVNTFGSSTVTSYINVFCATRSKSFGYLQRIAMEISSSIEPALIVKTLRIDNQRVPIPVAVRPAHPAWSGWFAMVVHIDRSDGTGVLMDHHDVLWGFELSGMERAYR